MWKSAIPLILLLAFSGLIAQRVWRTASNGESGPMPARTRLEEAAQQALYQTPAGRYTRDDIQANGFALPADRYRGFVARHDANPGAGESLCPISRTRANPECTWIIDGQVYAFCCPPCIDELVRLAKEEPHQLRPPQEYVQE